MSPMVTAGGKRMEGNSITQVGNIPSLHSGKALFPLHSQPDRAPRMGGERTIVLHTPPNVLSRSIADEHCAPERAVRASPRFSPCIINCCGVCVTPQAQKHRQLLLGPRGPHRPKVGALHRHVMPRTAGSTYMDGGPVHCWKSELVICTAAHDIVCWQKAQLLTTRGPWNHTAGLHGRLVMNIGNNSRPVRWCRIRITGIHEGVFEGIIKLHPEEEETDEIASPVGL